MQFRIWKVLVLLPLLAASCAQDPAAEQPARGKISATIGSDPQIGIKPFTALGDDGVTVTWTEGDNIALWAMKPDGSAQFAAKPFTLWHYNAEFNAAKFTADIDAMPENTYTYYAVSPRPQSLSDMQASYTIPEVQNGVFDGKCDVMVAAPVEGKALREGDNSDIVNLQFTHKIHVLKIRIPENRMNMPVSALELTFPEHVAVTGTLTVDATAPAAAPTLTDGSNVLRLEFVEPIDTDSEVCAIIAPVELTAADKITIKAYTDTKESVPTTMRGKNFREAHTTPIALTIPEIYRVTIIDFSLTGDGTATLGEKVNAITLTAPAGVDLGEGTNIRTFTVNDDNRYSISYEGEFIDNLSGKELTVSYDSQSAFVSNKFTIPQLTADERNAMTAFSVPYLFEETFGDVNGQGFDDEKGDGEGWGIALDGTSSHNNKVDVDMNLSGWSGQRIGSKANTAIRVNSCHYRPRVSSSNKYYNGSLTSPALKGLKTGVTANVKVTFYATRSSNNTVGYFGSTTATGNPTYDNSGQKGVSVETLDGYDNIKTLNEFSLSATSAHRLSWNVTNNKEEGWGFSSSTSRHYLYIDNVKVTIVK